MSRLRQSDHRTARCAHHRIEVRFRRWSDDAVRASLAAFWSRTGRAPKPADVQQPWWARPCARTLRRRYGGSAEAWRTLGPVPAA
jgi:hypothetical protein